MRLGKNEALYQYLAQNHPELVEDDFFKPDIQAVVSVPQKAPKEQFIEQKVQWIY